MKKTMLMIFLLLCLGKIKAQDTITKLNGEIIIAKISEITPTEIKYKRLDLSDGPNYIESKKNVKSIRFSNGVEEKIDPKLIPSVSSTNEPVFSNKIEIRGINFFYHRKFLSQNRMHEMLLQTNNKEISKLVVKAKIGKKMQYIIFAGIPLGITGIAFFAVGLDEEVYDDQYSSIYYSLGLICVTGAITCPILSGIGRYQKNKYNREAIKLYNEQQ